MTLPYVPSANVAELKPSATLAVGARAKALKAQGRPIIDLGMGEPDFDTPDFIKAAAARAIAGGATKYTAPEGILPLREAIAAQAAARYAGADAPTALDVCVSGGSKQVLFNACFSLFGPGDEVLIPAPAWTSYWDIVRLARATPVTVLGDPANDWKVTVEALEAAATPRTRGIIVNSPCNPTGAVLAPDELRAILDLAARRGWWVISDEIYRRIAYDAPAMGALDLVGARDNLVVVDGVAKAYAMTGWRIGWAIAPRAVSKMLADLQGQTTSNTSTPSQHAALAALTERDAAEESIGAMVRAFKQRRDAALAILAEPGAPRVVTPAGAFYLYMDVSETPSETGDAGTAFVNHMLDRHDVAIVPGAAFGSPGWVRLSYAAAERDVVAAVRRITDAYRAIRGTAVAV
jgi:aspartate aminotransferase